MKVETLDPIPRHVYEDEEGIVTVVDKDGEEPTVAFACLMLLKAMLDLILVDVGDE
jgi:hypothetical protein